MAHLQLLLRRQLVVVASQAAFPIAVQRVGQHDEFGAELALILADERPALRIVLVVSRGAEVVQVVACVHHDVIAGLFDGVEARLLIGGIGAEQHGFSDMPVNPSFCMLATVAAYSLCLRFET